MLFLHARRGVAGHDVGHAATDMVIGTRVFKESRDAFGVARRRGRSAGRVGHRCIAPVQRFDVTLEFGPALEPIFPRDDQLGIAEGEPGHLNLMVASSGELWMRLADATKRFELPGSVAVEEILGLVLQMIQAGTGRQ